MSGFVYKLRRLCAVVVGTVFFLSGIFKLMDPVGTGLIVAEYFKFFHTSFLDFGAGIAGIFLAMLETLTGAALITNVFRKAAAITASVMTLFFTVVTVFLLIFNPNMSCGCFGKVVELTHMQSFMKNVVLCVLCADAFLPFRDFGSPAGVKYAAFALVASAVIAGTVFCAVSLPPVDYTAFAPGAELYTENDAEEVPDFGETAAFIYEKDGRQGVFTLDRLPDSTWTFVGTDTLRRELPIAEKEIAVLSFTDMDGEYCDYMATEGKVMVVSFYDPEGLSARVREGLPALKDRLLSAGFTPLFIFASAPSRLDVPEGIEPYFADYRTLVALNRSNGGATYISDGTVIRKWAGKFIPDGEGLEKAAKTNPADLAVSTVTKGRIRLQAFLLYGFAVMLLL